MVVYRMGVYYHDNHIEKLCSSGVSQTWQQIALPKRRRPFTQEAVSKGGLAHFSQMSISRLELFCRYYFVRSLSLGRAEVYM